MRNRNAGRRGRPRRGFGSFGASLFLSFSLDFSSRICDIYHMTGYTDKTKLRRDLARHGHLGPRALSRLPRPLPRRGLRRLGPAPARRALFVRRALRLVDRLPLIAPARALVAFLLAIPILLCSLFVRPR